MDRMIHTALNALGNQRDTRVTQAQNLANMNVPGYRRDLPNEGKAWFANAMNTATVRAFQVETGPGGFLTQSGPLQQTGEALDVAVIDDGYLYTKPESGGDPALTRRGDLRRDLDGTLRNGAGDVLLDTFMEPIQVPAYRTITISDIGEIWIDPANSPPGAEPYLAGALATFVPDDKTKLVKSADGYIRNEKGEAPDPNQLAKLQQGMLEGSNVNSVEELISSIDMQRQFELGLRMVKTAQELDEAGARLLRDPQA